MVDSIYIEKHHLCEHPLLEHYVSKVRDLSVTQLEFRRTLGLIGQLLFVEASKGQPLITKKIRMWRGHLDLDLIDQSKICLISVLRGAMGMTESVTELVPDAPVGFIASTRDSDTLEITTHYTKIPDVIDTDVYIFDVMLGTGSTLSSATNLLKKLGARKITCITAISSPQGLEKMKSSHPDVSIFTAKIDSELDDRGMIYPGTGDIGERSFNQEKYNRKFDGNV